MQEEMSKSFRRLLVPYITINAICLILWTCTHFSKVGISGILTLLCDSFYLECVTLCYPLWFLLSLAIVRILFQVVNKGSSYVYLSLCFSLVASFAMNKLSYGVGNEVIPHWIGNICLGFFFYTLGYILNKVQYDGRLCIAALIIYIFHLFFPMYLDFYNNKTDIYFLAVIYDLAGVIVFNNMFYRYVNKRIRILTHIGENSMVYYITHGTFFYMLYVAHSFQQQGWMLYGISIITTCIFLYFMDRLFEMKYLKWIVGK